MFRMVSSPTFTLITTSYPLQSARVVCKGNKIFITGHDWIVFLWFLFQARRSCWSNAAVTLVWSTLVTPGRPSRTTGRWLASSIVSECGAMRTTIATSAISCVFLATTTLATIAASLQGLRCAWMAGWTKTAKQVSCLLDLYPRRGP